MAPANPIEIRPLHGIDEFVQAEDVQRVVWKMDVDTSIVPAAILSPVSKNSGVVLGAFDGPKLVGICFSFLGRTPEGRMEHWSHMNGVLEAYEGQRLGEELKWAQREAVLAMDVDLIRWTTDALEGRPAALNFGKLGVTCRTYDINVYGVMPDGLNAGIESDRFIVDWELDTERVEKRRAEGRPKHSAQAWEAEGAQPANLTEGVTEGVRRITELRLDLDAPRILIEPPASYQHVKLHDLDLAIEWRMKTRELFTTYFGRGYVVTEFVSEVRDSERRNFLALEQN
jgi:predicted GNAT superfamily acetyltransferase